MSGYVLIHRKLWEHPAFRDFAEAAAFAWMISQAAWQESRVRYKDRAITLARGQLSISCRDASKRFGWTEAKVRRFWERLKNEAMIDALTDAGVTVITLCNYDEYQASAHTDDAPSGTPPTHRRRTADAQNKEGNEVNKYIPPSEDAEPASLDALLFQRGKALLGSGGMVTKLRKAVGDDVAALALLNEAKGKADPREWIAGVINKRSKTPKTYTNEFGEEVEDYDPHTDPLYEGVL